MLQAAGVLPCRHQLASLLALSSCCMLSAKQRLGQMCTAAQISHQATIMGSNQLDDVQIGIMSEAVFGIGPNQRLYAYM